MQKNSIGYIIIKTYKIINKVSKFKIILFWNNDILIFFSPHSFNYLYSSKSSIFQLLSIIHFK